MMTLRSPRLPWVSDLMWEHFGPLLPNQIYVDSAELNRLNVNKLLSAPEPRVEEFFGETLNERELVFTEKNQSMLAGRMVHSFGVKREHRLTEPTPLAPPMPGPSAPDRRLSIFTDAANPPSTSIDATTFSKNPMKRSVSPQRERHQSPPKHQKLDVEASPAEEEQPQTEELSPMGNLEPEPVPPPPPPPESDPDMAELPDEEEVAPAPEDPMDLDQPVNDLVEQDEPLQEEQEEEVAAPVRPFSPPPPPPPLSPPPRKAKTKIVPAPTPKARVVVVPKPPPPPVSDEEDQPPEDREEPQREPTPPPPQPIPPAKAKAKKAPVKLVRPPTPEPEKEVDEEEEEEGEDSMLDEHADTEGSGSGDSEPPDAEDLEGEEESRSKDEDDEGDRYEGDGPVVELPPVNMPYEKRFAKDIEKAEEQDEEKKSKPKTKKVPLPSATAKTAPIKPGLSKAAPKAAKTQKLNTRLMAAVAKMETAQMSRTLGLADFYLTDAKVNASLDDEIIKRFRWTWDDAVCRALNVSFKKVIDGVHKDEGVSFESDMLTLSQTRVLSNTVDSVHMYQQLCWAYTKLSFSCPEGFTESTRCVLTFSNPRTTEPFPKIFSKPSISRTIYCRYIPAVLNIYWAVRPWEYSCMRATKMVNQIRKTGPTIARERILAELSPWDTCGKNIFRDWINTLVFSEWDLHLFN